MTKYLYLENFRKPSVRLGISTKVFQFIGQKSIKNIKEIIANDPSTQIAISVRNNVVVYKINVAVKKNTNKDAIKEQINDYLYQTMNFICDSLSYESHIKVSEKNI